MNLGPLLVSMKRAGATGIGAATIAKLEEAGLSSASSILQITEAEADKLGIPIAKLHILKGYLRRR